MEILAGVKPTALSGRYASRIELKEYRSSLFAPVWTKKALPSTVAARNAILYQHPTIPQASSVNWVKNLCAQMGLDGNTSPMQLYPNYAAGHFDAQLSLRREGEYIYVVPPDQPLRTIVDQDTTTGSSTAHFNALVDKLGGLPVPYDARPDATPDRYCGVYQPETETLVNLYAFGTTDPATTTLRPSGGLVDGSFHASVTYGDHAAFTNAYTTQTPIQFDATAAQVKACVDSAQTAAGALFGNLTALTRTQAAGGPLNVAPVVLTFPFCDAMTTAQFTMGVSTLGPGTVAFDHHPAGPYDRCRRGSIITPSDDGVIAHGSTVFPGRYTKKTDGAGFWWMDPLWNATATRIEQMGLVPSWEEAQAANQAGTGLGHMMCMVVGNAQQTPIPYVPPASGGDGTKINSPTWLAQGAVVTLPPDIDLSWIAQNVPEFLFVPRTMRDNGVITIDKTGIGCEILLRRAQWPGDTYNPWPQVLTRYIGATASAVSHFYMRQVPWHHAQIIDPSYWQ